MGFGYLLFGFMMMLQSGPETVKEFALGLDVLPDLAGYLFMIGAARRLKDYSGHFSKMLLFLLPLCLTGALTLATQFMGLFGIAPSIASEMIRYARLPELVLQLLAFIFMYLGIREISRDTESVKIEKRTSLGITMCCVYYLFRWFLNIENAFSTFGLPEYTLGICSIIAEIIFYIFVAYTLFEIFSCYMYICQEGDENMEKSRIYNPLAELYEKAKKRKEERNKNNK